MSKSDSLIDPVKLRLFLISTSCPDIIETSIRVSRVHSRMASPACHPCYPGSPSIGYGSFRQDRCFGLPPSMTGSTTPLITSRLHLGSLTLRPAGLLTSLNETLSGNLMLRVAPNISLKLRGCTTEFPQPDFIPVSHTFYTACHTYREFGGCRKSNELWFNLSVL